MLLFSQVFISIKNTFFHIILLCKICFAILLIHVVLRTWQKNKHGDFALVKIIHVHLSERKSNSHPKVAIGNEFKVRLVFDNRSSGPDISSSKRHAVGPKWAYDTRSATISDPYLKVQSFYNDSCEIIFLYNYTNRSVF